MLAVALPTVTKGEDDAADESVAGIGDDAVAATGGFFDLWIVLLSSAGDAGVASFGVTLDCPRLWKPFDAEEAAVVVDARAPPPMQTGDGMRGGRFRSCDNDAAANALLLLLLPLLPLLALLRASGRGDAEDGGCDGGRRTGASGGRRPDPAAAAAGLTCAALRRHESDASLTSSKPPSSVASSSAAPPTAAASGGSIPNAG